MKKFLRSMGDLLFADNHPIVRNIVSALLFGISLLGLDIGFRHIYKEGVVPLFENNVALLFSFAWIFILVSISFILPRLARRIYHILAVTVYAVFATAHAFFFSFNGIYLTLSSAIFAGDGAAFFDWSYFTIPKKFIALVLLCLVLGTVSALIVPKTKYSIVRVVCPVLALAAGITGCVLCKNHYFTDDGVVVWNSARTPLEIYESFSDTRACLHSVGLFHYTFRDVSNVTGLTDLVDRIANGDTVEALDTFYAEKDIDPDNEMTGIFKDKNMILIQLESIDTWMVNDVAMPYFNSLCKESINFDNFYAPKFLAAATFNTETIVNTGFITPMNSSKVSYFTDNYYPYSAAHLFAEEGYAVESYHRSNGGIYNRGAAHKNWGYSKYNSGADMGMRDANLDTEIMQAYDDIVKDEKYMSFIITYSGHGPYDGTSVEVESYYDIIKPQVPEDAKDEYVWALCHAYETDRFIEMLCSRLEEDGVLEDTVLVFYSDHYDHYVTDTSILTEQKGGTDTNLWCRIPFVIYNKGTEPATVDKVINTFDILPTIVNLFDLNTDGRYYIGNDAFSENGGYAFFSNHSWVDGETYFDVNTDTPTELSKKLGEEITLRMNMNYDTVKTDYFRKKAEQ